jgi:hypothetical protein
MEYLMTYGWAILIISVVLSALYMMGLFNPATFVNSQCIFPAQFSCINSYLSPNGQLSVNIEQALSAPINVTAIGCNTNATTSEMKTYASAIYIPIGSNYTFSLWCWAGNSNYTASPGSVYHGYIIMNYTDIQSGFPHTAIASLLQKVT